MVYTGLIWPLILPSRDRVFRVSEGEESIGNRVCHDEMMTVLAFLGGEHNVLEEGSGFL